MSLELPSTVSDKFCVGLLVIQYVVTESGNNDAFQQCEDDRKPGHDHFPILNNLLK